MYIYKLASLLARLLAKGYTPHPRPSTPQLTERRVCGRPGGADHITSLVDIPLLGPLRNSTRTFVIGNVEEPQPNDLGSSSSTPPPRNLARNLALLCER